MKDHVSNLTVVMEFLLDAYSAKHEDCDLNDVLSAVALMFISLCKQHDVSRTTMLGGLNQMYEDIENERAH
jgi:hypothetical protein